MGRPPGSKNKPKVEAIPDAVPAIVESPTPPPWEPKPNMGDIKPPKAEELPCGCGHAKKDHYGPKTDWCNVNGCRCQRFN